MNHKSCNFGLFVAITSVLFFCSLPHLAAQTSYGSVVGNVVDATGSAVPGANVTLTNISTGTERTANTGSDGTYSFAYVSPGRYRVEIEHRGFQKFIRE